MIRFVMAAESRGVRASFTVDPDTLSFERKKHFITRNLEVNLASRQIYSLVKFFAI